MGRNGTGVLLRQDNEQFTVPRKSPICGGNVRNSGAPECSTFSLRCWPLLVALINVIGAVIALRLAFRLNISRSAPRGIYWRLAEPPARGTLVAACLPFEVARLARDRGYLGPGACTAGVEPVLKVIGAMFPKIRLIPGAAGTRRANQRCGPCFRPRPWSRLQR